MLGRLVFAAALLASQMASAQVARQMMIWSPGSGTGYSGPNDVVAGATAWWGLRAFSQATAGTASANICLPSAGACADMNTDATTGALTLTAIGGTSCNDSTVICTIKTIYDKAGSANMVQNTEANRPVLLVNGPGSKPVAKCGTGQNMTATFPSTLNPSLSLATVFYVDDPGTPPLGGGAMFGGNSENVYLWNHVGLYKATLGGLLTSREIPMNYATWYAGQFAYASGASTSTANLGGTTATSTNLGTTGLANNAVQFCNSGSGSLQLLGRQAEVGVWPVLFSSGQMTDMTANANSFWSISGVGGAIATTYNPKTVTTGMALSGGNLTFTGSGGSFVGIFGTSSKITGTNGGKWYYEVTIGTVNNDGADGNLAIGVLKGDYTTLLCSSAFANATCYFPNSGKIYFNNSLKATAATAGAGAVVGIEVDLGSNRSFAVNVNGGSFTSCSTCVGTGANIYPYAQAFQQSSTNGSATANFSPSSPPSGYTAWQ